MATADHVLALDQGTTSTRALLFDSVARCVASAQRDLPQHYPHPGWVEHDAEDIWRDTLAVLRQVSAAVDPARIAALGLANQRETVVVWDRASGLPVHRALVWQDRRTADHCAALRADGAEHQVAAKTGLLLDPYFSATKFGWILDNVSGARARAVRGQLAAGTIDSFLLWRLTGGAVHATDVTNAARTSLYDIHRQCWDDDLCRLFGVPLTLLPDVRDSSADYGMTEPGLLNRQLPICGVAGDQQAALFGQACFEAGMAKATFGTGAFLLLNTGETAVRSGHRLLTTPTCRIDGRMIYALEGSVFVAGAAVKWLRDTLGLIDTAAETEKLAASVADDHGVTLVPGFVGLGAPHWRPDLRASLHGLSLDSGPAHIARAALEAVAFQTTDLLAAMVADGAVPPAALRIDGGMAANCWLCRFLADVANVRVERPANLETTALGAAFLAGLGSGVWSGLADLRRIWCGHDAFDPAIDEQRRAALLGGWHDALGRALG